MLYNYMFVYKLISFKNFNIVSPVTFVNKSNIELTLYNIWRMSEKHPRSRPKHVSMNSWNYTEYIPVVPHYLTNNWANLLWPIRHLVKTTCSFRFWPQEQGVLSCGTKKMGSKWGDLISIRLVTYMHAMSSLYYILFQCYPTPRKPLGKHDYCTVSRRGVSAACGAI
jgi:hypothetical protein